ncbi:SH3 domain-containing protein [Campylobacter sp. VTCC 70190]|uniref:SH3 domain-containing C40 family peptidase n=1 Tax=Campylobacter sp. VTCC 70190 TaxID=3392118 RepID=UPI00398E628A
MKFCLYMGFLLLFLTACSTKNLTPPQSPELEQKKENSNYAKLEFEQNTSILPQLTQNIHFNAKEYKKRFFSPWHDSFKNYKAQNLFWSFPAYLNPKNTYYFFNKQKIPIAWFKDAVSNANTQNLGKLNQKALIVQNTISKNLPTQRAILKNPFFENEGFPFDYASDSILNVGTPVLISHFSKDKRYAFILSEVGVGFVESKNLEIFSNHRAKIYEKLDFITPLKEKLAVFSDDGNFFFESRIGAIYPYYKEDKNYFYGKIGSKKYKISKKNAAKFPLKFSDENLKNQLSQVLNLPYGWGGFDFERDCSLLTRDIFSAFGLYLPRNSAAQKNFFNHFDISTLSNSQKKDFLNRFGKAYLSLLYLPGHIMLYAGKISQTDVAIHNIWGLRKNATQRLLIGSSVISSLEIGKNEILEENLLLSRLKEVSFITLSKEEKEQIATYLQNIEK